MTARARVSPAIAKVRHHKKIVKKARLGLRLGLGMHFLV